MWHSPPLLPTVCGAGHAMVAVGAAPLCRGADTVQRLAVIRRHGTAALLTREAMAHDRCMSSGCAA